VSERSTHFDLPAGLEAPAAARHGVVSTLHGWGFRDQRWTDAAALVVTELVTNAVRHAGGCLLLDLSAQGGVVVVGAVDGTAMFSRIRDADQYGGRGLLIVEAFSVRWGVHGHESGKRVWAQLLPCQGHPCAQKGGPAPADRRRSSR
jgi:anti-sigma regulatory factor (Ser/Thr protein kinase)